MSSSKPYLNFDLSLSGADNRYRAKVVNSPAKQAVLDFVLPFSQDDLKSFIKTSQNRSNIRSLDLKPADLQTFESLGRNLFDCLFAGSVGNCFHTSLAIARRENTGLRVRLNCADAPTLINVPWELLFDSENNDYIGLSIQTPIIRKLDLAHYRPVRQAEKCLRILIMISSPKDHSPLDVEREWKRIDQATKELQKADRIILKRIPPSLSTLQVELRQGSFHVFHYIGHGGFSQKNNDGVLVLEDNDHNGDLVNGRYLGTILRDESSLQLALLNSCSGGRTSVADPFAGVGQSLLQKGIPAVIAMQFEITDEAAITFSSEFYSALVDGYSIETAVAEARKMIYASANKLEWATPVLYTSVEGVALMSKIEKADNGEDSSPKNPKAGGTNEDKINLIRRQLLLSTNLSELRKVRYSLKEYQTENAYSADAYLLYDEIEKAIRREDKHRSLDLDAVAPGRIQSTKIDHPYKEKMSTFFWWVTVGLLIGGLYFLKDFFEHKNPLSTVGLPATTVASPPVAPTIELENKSITVDSTWLNLIKIPAGSFIMGSNLGSSDERPERKVKIAESFWMGRTEVTFDQYDAYASSTGKEKPRDEGWGRVNRPVINVSWHDAQGYVKWLSTNNDLRLECRLPSEAEWEFAARSGTTTEYFWGDTIGKNKANCYGCGSGWDEKKTAPVASFPPNQWGLYDMHGNTGEWVQDPWHQNYSNAPKNGDVWSNDGHSSWHVLRSGAWNFKPNELRSANRINYTSDLRRNFTGFRVVCT